MAKQIITLYHAAQKPITKDQQALGIAFSLSIFAVWSGLSEMQSQSTTIERLKEKDKIDRDSVIAHQPDYGMAAYYTFNLTYSEPSSLAFAAIGQRDVYPWKHRIRMLAIEGQIYETDADNPELSFLGRFDFAFLISILLPLFVILLLHDLRSSEREAGRYDLLLTTAVKQKFLWFPRAFVMSSALGGVILVPFIVGAIISGASFVETAFTIMVVVAHILFWTLLIFWYTSSRLSSNQNSTKIASVLLSVWILVSVLIPVASDVAIDNMVTSPSGADILLTQREAVNDAWDLPESDTWDAFLADYPQWKDHIDMGPTFEWKWYYAFQQVGDKKVSELSKAYQQATLKKDTLAGKFALLSPPMLTQRLMSSLAKTDTRAAMQYEQDIRAYHEALRHFYYPLLFTRAEYSLETMSTLPKFSDYSTQ
ncbi:DUF3526 domain-containing protein [Aliiglaciecola aliphaticivorans]